MSRALIQEEDIVSLITDSEHMVLMVLNTEDLVYDETGYGTVAASTLGSYTRITNIEPKDIGSPYREIYDLRVGIDAGQGYAEVLSGTARRGTNLVPKPTSNAPYVAYFDDMNSPFEDPKFSMVTMYKYIPAFAVYNPHGMTISPNFSFRGIKSWALDLKNKESVDAIMKRTGMIKADAQAYVDGIVREVSKGKRSQVRHKSLTLMGLPGSGGS